MAPRERSGNRRVCVAHVVPRFTSWPCVNARAIPGNAELGGPGLLLRRACHCDPPAHQPAAGKLARRCCWLSCLLLCWLLCLCLFCLHASGPHLRSPPAQPAWHFVFLHHGPRVNAQAKQKPPCSPSCRAMLTACLFHLHVSVPHPTCPPVLTAMCMRISFRMPSCPICC